MEFEIAASGVEGNFKGAVAVDLAQKRLEKPCQSYNCHVITFGRESKTKLLLVKLF